MVHWSGHIACEWLIYQPELPLTWTELNAFPNMNKANSVHQRVMITHLTKYVPENFILSRCSRGRDRMVVGLTQPVQSPLTL